LANHKVSQLKEILNEAGPRFRVHVPETWPEQAGLLRDGKTDAFKALTERLKGGRRV
jgi:large subunit ribosomal protein L17